jgi:polysaccharide pyruvyl transferase WcaK-like protein
MQVLVDQVIHSMRNKGNVALLQVALRRILRLFPGARLEVLTDAPNILKYYAPEAQPLVIGKPQGSPGGGGRWEAVHRFVPSPALRWVLECREQLRSRRVPPCAVAAAEPCGKALSVAQRSAVPAANHGEPAAREELDPRLLAAIGRADLVVTSGGGYLSDSDKVHLMRTLAILERASRSGTPTAMLGQGVGEIRDPELLARLSQVLPLVDLILVRERLFAPAFLRSLGVASCRVVMTGDDAIEMAYAGRREAVGSRMGVSLRIAGYTGIGKAHLEAIGQVLRTAIKRLAAPAMPIPISCDSQERDDATIDALLGQEFSSGARWKRFVPPAEIARAVGNCRMVVAGAFHAAVFALGQGIPVVAIAKSEEYYNKFAGLREEFGPACQIVSLDEHSFADSFSAAIDSAWRRAAELRPAALEAAAWQNRLGESGYSRLKGLVHIEALVAVGSGR